MNENDNNDNIVAENVDKLKKGLIKFHRKN